jgi:hypothetical protein
MADLVRRKVLGVFLSTEAKPLKGRVEFLPSSTVLDLNGNVVLLERSIVAYADSTGLIEANLPITNDPRHVPTGWQYKVLEAFDGGPSRGRYFLDVPDSAFPVNLADAVEESIPPKPEYGLTSP